MDTKKKIIISIDPDTKELCIDLTGHNEYEALGMLKIAMLNLEYQITNNTFNG